MGGEIGRGRGWEYCCLSCMEKVGEEEVVYKGRMGVDKYGRLVGDSGELFNFGVVGGECKEVGLGVSCGVEWEG